MCSVVNSKHCHKSWHNSSLILHQIFWPLRVFLTCQFSLFVCSIFLLFFCFCYSNWMLPYWRWAFVPELLWNLTPAHSQSWRLFPLLRQIRTLSPFSHVFHAATGECERMMAALSLAPAGVLVSGRITQSNNDTDPEGLWVTPVVEFQRDSGNQRRMEDPDDLEWVKCRWRCKSARWALRLLHNLRRATFLGKIISDISFLLGEACKAQTQENPQMKKLVMGFNTIEPQSLVLLQQKNKVRDLVYKHNKTVDPL